MDSEVLESMKVSELKILCKEKGLRVTGNKSELIERIQQSNPNSKLAAKDMAMDVAKRSWPRQKTWPKSMAKGPGQRCWPGQMSKPHFGQG